jgi:uncharacterized protein YceH (UPF0502 family)
MVMVGRLLNRKRNLIARLSKNPGRRERDEIECLLVKVDTALERNRLAAEEGVKAVHEVTQQAVAVRENMVRLRALRLAKEAQEEPTID